MSAEIAAGLFCHELYFMWEPNNLLHALIYFLLHFENEIYFITQYNLNPPKKFEKKKPNVVQVSCFFYTLGLGENKSFKLF
jgi:hypothetical protein